MVFGLAILGGVGLADADISASHCDSPPSTTPPPPTPPPCSRACGESFNYCMQVQQSYAVCRSEIDLEIEPASVECSSWCTNTASMAAHANGWQLQIEADPAIAQLSPGEEQAAQLLKQAIEYVEQVRSTTIIGPVVSRAWDEATPSQPALAALHALAIKVSKISEPTPHHNWPITHLGGQLETLAVSTGALELKAFSGMLRDRDFLLDTLNFQARLDHLTAVMGHFVAAGREDLGQKYFDRQVGAGGPLDSSIAPANVHHLVEHWWYGRCAATMCPPLRPFGALEGTDVDKILPAGLADTLRLNFGGLADEARTFLKEEPGDIWPGILSGGHWQGAVLYRSSIFVDEGRARDAAWNNHGCGKLPLTCSLIRGRLRSEAWGFRKGSMDLTEPMNQEEVTYFSLGPNQFVPQHTGQQGRVNVHLCLLNCERSFVETNFTKLQYRTGELMAFDDGLFHSIQNHDPVHTRVILAIGVMHPQRTESRDFCYPERSGYD